MLLDNSCSTLKSKNNLIPNICWNWLENVNKVIIFMKILQKVVVNPMGIAISIQWVNNFWLSACSWLVISLNIYILMQRNTIRSIVNKWKINHVAIKFTQNSNSDWFYFKIRTCQQPLVYKWGRQRCPQPKLMIFNVFFLKAYQRKKEP